MNWIKIRDQQPEIGKRIIVRDRYKNDYKALEYNGKKEYRLQISNCVAMNRIYEWCEVTE